MKTQKPAEQLAITPQPKQKLTATARRHCCGMSVQTGIRAGTKMPKAYAHPEWFGGEPLPSRP